MSEVEETISRIKSHKSVEGLLITDKDKRIIRTNYTGDRAHEGDLLRVNVPLLAEKARNIIRDLDPTNDLTFLRIKTKAKEIMVAPDKEFMLITMQKYGKDAHGDS